MYHSSGSRFEKNGPCESRDRSGVIRLVLVLVLAYYLPVFLLWFGIIPFRLRFHILVAMALLMSAYAACQHRGYRSLGLRADTLKGSLAWNGLLSVTLASVLLVLHIHGLPGRSPTTEPILFYVFYVLISSPCQEFLFRSSLFAEMNAAGVTSPFWQILLSAVTYSFLHVIYRDPITLAVTLLMGILWGVIYYRYPNLLGVTVSHAVLGAVSIIVGLV